MKILAHINSNQEEQSLHEHSVNTFTAIETYAAARGLTNCMKLTAFLHDCGKASQGFQEYIRKAALENIFLPKVNHSSAGAQILLEVCQQYTTSDDTLVKLMLVQTIVSHHGLSDFFNVSGENMLHKRCYPEKELDMKHIKSYVDKVTDSQELSTLFIAAQQELFKYVTDIVQQNTTKDYIDIFFHLGALQRLMLSLLIHGDREDTRNFMEHTRTTSYQEDSIWKAASENLESHIVEITKKSTKNKINELRTDISNQCKEFGCQPSGIYRLSCPTGSGKTLASLRYALQHAQIYHKKHIIYVAPYKTILEQNAEVMKQFFLEDIVLEHHSNIIPSEYTDYDYYSSSWNKPVILTTAVRFFDTLFKDRTTDVRRFHQLADSIVILDEAQKIPVKTVSMFNEMMNFLACHCNTTIVLCTATQPLLEKTTYPIRLASNSEIVQQTEELYEQFKRVHIEDVCRSDGYTMTDVSDFIFQKQKPGNSLLAIVNTKAEALDLYHACKLHHELHDMYLYHLSTGMCPEHRQDKLKEMEEHVIKKDTVLCIATNLIEAGVDIDCDIVIRSLCGLDSILQAAGRCNRNGNNDDLGIVYLINSSEEHIDKLTDVKKGQNETSILLAQLHKSKEGSNVDELLSLSYIEQYYESYFFSRRHDMGYSTVVDGKKVTLFDLLTQRGHPTKNSEALFHPYLGQALKSAGHKFEMIDSDSIGILVPYGGGSELIAKLQSSISNAEKYALLDQAQRFMVNVYENKYKEMMKEDMLVQLEFNGMLVLKEGFYKEDTGLEIKKELEDMFV